MPQACTSSAEVSRGWCVATGPRAAALTHLLKSQTTQNLLSPKRIPLQLTSDEVEPSPVSFPWQDGELT
ncbi:hypothetical protein ACRRTK_011921 [Alexandromys fortis]